MRELAALKNLTTLNLIGTGVTDVGVKDLVGLKNLTSLHLTGSQVTDRTLRTLREAGLLHALVLAEAAGGRRPTRAEDVLTLNLRGTSVTDEGMKELVVLKNLTTFYPSASEERIAKVTNAGLKELAPLKNLTTIEWFNVTDETLKVLREAGLLHALSHATGADGRRPAKVEEVVSLNLNHNFSKVTGAGLKELGGLKNLTALDLPPTALTDEGMKTLRELNWMHTIPRARAAKDQRPAKPEDVTTFDLSGTPASDAALKELVPLKNLTTLNLSGVRLSAAGLKQLAGLESLSSLDLSGAPLTDAALKELAVLKALTTLNLAGTRVTDAGLKELVVVKSLTALDLSRLKVTPAGLKELASLEKLVSLTVRGVRLTDAQFQEVEKSLPKCKLTRK